LVLNITAFTSPLPTAKTLELKFKIKAKNPIGIASPSATKTIKVTMIYYVCPEALVEVLTTGVQTYNLDMENP